MNDYVYQYNDVFVTPGNTRVYQETIGQLSRTQSSFDQVIGTFAVRRISGSWPRVVNLWESTWADLAAALPHHDPKGASAPRPPGFGAVADEVRRQRRGGWDRFLLPGPGSPDLAALRRFTAEHGPRPCVVQLIVSLRDDARADYLRWFVDSCSAATGRWRPLLWFTAVHDPQVFVYFAGPTWAGLEELASVWPPPPPVSRPATETWLLEAWPGSLYLQPPS
jgi:hypothetical protein